MAASGSFKLREGVLVAIADAVASAAAPRDSHPDGTAAARVE